MFYCWSVLVFWFLKLESSMAMRFFASCWSGFPLFLFFFSRFGLVCDSLSFFSLLVWFKFFFFFFSVGLVCGGGEEGPSLLFAAYNSQLAILLC
jgi:hypothetical protein